MEISYFSICTACSFFILTSCVSPLEDASDASASNSNSALGGLYADNGIDQTVIVAPLPREEKKHMQEELLELLGLHSRPRPQNQETSQAAPKYMLNLYESFVDEDSGLLKVDGDKLIRVRDRTLTENNASLNSMNEADEIISFPNQVGKQHPRSRNKRFLFDLSKVPADHKVIGAEFHLFKAYSWKQPWFHNFTIFVYLITRGADLEDREMELLDQKLTYTIEKGWIIFNVTRAAELWISSAAKNYGLLIDIISGTGESLDPSDISIALKNGPEDKEGFMVAFFKQSEDEPILARRKRSSTPIKNRRKPQTSKPQNLEEHVAHNGIHRDYPFLGFDVSHSNRACKKKTLYVSFRQLGWQDWIIAPDGYPANFCGGECSFPLNAHMNATNHAIVQTLVHLFNPVQVPKALCAATKLSAITMLYFDDNSNVVLKKYREMIAKGCGCH
ncbi:hypothetical protein RvY_15793 [Ramazzottius varieornatus]|uniref:TGF-beta family profile domain-containing protein n=1 Tax=Ramazzottius varieornatus TaxID=947166 RepID=A0A1D1VXA3_RAMVA|nr:hypothetical protein RvY_15793 [Ramazzottius varieornatus]